MADTATPPAPGVANVPSAPPGTSAPVNNAPPGPPGVSQPNHLPPQPPHLTIPSSNNPIPTAITSPPGQGPWGPNGPTRGPAHRTGNSTLYVGNLVPSVDTNQLREIFSATIGDRGTVQNVKIIPDKNANARGLNYGFVELSDPAVAEYAMLTLNGRRIHDMEIKINWAYMSNHSNKEDTSSHFHIFVGDLSQEVDDATLFAAFDHFGHCSEARVMWDMKTGRTRGYGFVAFRSYEAALKAIGEMDGEWLGSRQIRVNWANQKGQPSINQRSAMDGMGLPVGTTPYAARENGEVTQEYRDVWAKGAQTNSTTVYVGNLTPFTTNNDLFPLFANYGPIKEIRYQSDRGYAFIKYESKEQAAVAIAQMNNYVFNGRALKCSWGKDRSNSAQRGAAGAGPGGPPPASPYVHDGYVGGYPPSAGPASAVPPTPGSYYPPPGNPAMSPAVPTPGGYNYTPHGPYGSPSAHSGGPASGYPVPGSAGGYGRNEYQGGQWSQSPAGYGPSYNQSNYGGQYGSGGYNQSSYSGHSYSGQYSQGYNH